MGKNNGNRVGREEIHGDGVGKGTIYFTVSLSTLESCFTAAKARIPTPWSFSRVLSFRIVSRPIRYHFGDGDGKLFIGWGKPWEWGEDGENS